MILKAGGRDAPVWEVVRPLPSEVFHIGFIFLLKDFFQKMNLKNKSIGC